MDIIEKIINSSEEDIDKIVEEEIQRQDNLAHKIEQLGFINENIKDSSFKGFIPLKTRIKYSNFAIETYSMETTDYIYSFAHFMKQHDIKDKASIIHYLEYFIDDYFGPYQNQSREKIFNDIAWHSTTTDEEYFKALENNKLGDLKGTGAAECTERSALAEQILSVLGFDTYYCIGNYQDSNGRSEAHAFNVVNVKNGYVIVDYSLPIYSYNKEGEKKARYPFIGKMTEEEFNNFINNGIIKTFNNYKYEDGKVVMLDSDRSYKTTNNKLEINEEQGKQKF